MTDQDSSRILKKFVLEESKDTIIKLYYPNLNEFERFRIIRNRGDIDKNIQKVKVAYPFLKGKNYSIIQGYDGRFTHKSKKSRYAIEFENNIKGSDLKKGDKIKNP
ncbi:hypothetical protein [Psychroflexus lacisalsi]|uniref:hypothetical protein n=1 Tax=Psychroflexus lacisalsi TaxID=503928 RepID=UPI001CC92548|nr:hypothetical protein [Psychroflexus lacisalsi]MBZ9619264.1 hypothetical protein [Psychroflexus lacisalsi]